MAKVVVRKGSGVYEINVDTQHEIWDRNWLKKYQKLIEFQEIFGHQRLPYDDRSPHYTPEYSKLQKWANQQRMYYRRGTLIDWRCNMLEKIGFEWEPTINKWDSKYKDLLEFKEINGHCNVSKFDQKNKKLATWVSMQRKIKGRSSAERITKLDAIGFDWGVKRNKWDDMYEWLKSYYEEHGVAYVARDMSQGYSGNELNHLNRWIAKQVFYHNQGKLPPDKERMLNEINFNFNHLESIIKDAWERNFQNLLIFKEKYGHYNVPAGWEDMYLWRWVQRQRVKRNILPQEKIDRLNEIGFTWVFVDDVWEKNYEMLQTYYNEYGNSKVLMSQNKHLVGWMVYLRKIRRGYLSVQLTEEQIKRLDKLDFDWDPKYKFWNFCYKQLLDFKKEHGHCNVEFSLKTKVLYTWCKSNRNNKETLPEEKIKLLNEIGFEW